MSVLHHLFRSPPFHALVISLVIAGGVLGTRSMGYLEFLELTAYDWTIRLNPAPSPPDPRIVLIGITEDDIRTLGQWPLPDDTLAKTLEILTQAGARTIGLDLFRDFKVPPGHETLNSILTRNKDIITVLKFGDDLMRGVPGPPVLEGTDQVGFNDILVDSGGIVRRGLFFLENNEERIVTSFSLLLALRFLEPLGIFPEPDPDHPEDMRLSLTTFRRFQENDGGYNQADSRGYQYLVDFNSPVASTEQFSLTSLLQGEVPREAIVDKVVLIGTTAHSVKDDFYTPFSRGLYANQQMPGMELHAHMVSQLLRAALKGDATLRVPTEGQEILWMVVWGILGGMVGLKVRSPWGFSLAQVLTFGVLIGGALIAIMEKWWLPLVPPAFTWLISSAIVTAYMSKKESRERTMVMQLFSRHVSPEVANTIWGERDQFLKDGRLRSQKQVITALFTDLEGFSSVAEDLDPQDLMDWLNDYMDPMAKLIMSHGGIVDDYYGDAIKANFGVPFPSTEEAQKKQDALNAVKCAMAMEKEMCRLNERWKRKGRPTVKMRIGIFTGLAVVGSLGSAHRLKYTTIGDTVNIAARLESYEKDSMDQGLQNGVCRILIGETTQEYTKDQLWNTLEVGNLHLKGKQSLVKVYRILESSGSESNS